TESSSGMFTITLKYHYASRNARPNERRSHSRSLIPAIDASIFIVGHRLCREISEFAQEKAATSSSAIRVTKPAIIPALRHDRTRPRQGRYRRFGGGGEVESICQST